MLVLRLSPRTRTTTPCTSSPFQVFLLPLVQPLSTPMRNSVADWSHPNLSQKVPCLKLRRDNSVLDSDLRLAAVSTGPMANEEID